MEPEPLVVEEETEDEPAAGPITMPADVQARVGSIVEQVLAAGAEVVRSAPVPRWGWGVAPPQ